MTEREISGIRKKIILISTLTFFCVMLLMGGCIYLFSSITIRNEALMILNYISENDGELPTGEDSEKAIRAVIREIESTSSASSSDGNGSDEMIAWDLQHIFGIGDSLDYDPDMEYTTRYFSVLFDDEGGVESVKYANIAYLDEEQAAKNARNAVLGGKAFGNFGRYYYLVSARSSGGILVTYLDRTAQITLARRILFALLCLLGLGTLLAFFFMRVFSKRFVRTELENVKKQKQFITNASHELKTPLAVIRANTEMQEILNGESEWTASTIRQVDRMNGLIQTLVKISRSQETEGMNIREMNISPAVKETAESFMPVAASDNKKIETGISDPVTVMADDSRVRQLVSLLADNAVKYCDPDGMIRIDLSKSGKTAVLSVSNDYAAGRDTDYSRFFERFYREDEAHTINAGTDDAAPAKSGYGIGLSLAESIVKSMKGTIKVSWKNGMITFTCRFG